MAADTKNGQKKTTTKKSAGPGKGSGKGKTSPHTRGRAARARGQSTSARKKADQARPFWTWRKGVLLGVLLLFAYLLVGMCLPFWAHPDLNPFTERQFSADTFYGDQESVDRAAILETGESALDERIRLISQAQESLILTTFDMRPGNSMDDLAAVILDAADRGVSVRILVDGISGRLRMEGKQPFDLLASHPNIEIRLYNRPNLLLPWTWHGRMHDKYVVADDMAYILGGRNTFDYFLGDYPTEGKSLDREVLIYNTAHGQEASSGSSLHQVTGYFERIWSSEACTAFPARGREEENQQERQRLEEHGASLRASRPELFTADNHWMDATVPTNRVTLISGDTGIGGKAPVVWFQLQQLMESAQERVIFQTPYAVCSEEMLDGLRRLAQSGLDCRLLLNARENGDNVVASSDYTWRRGGIWDTGVTVYEYAGGTSSHGKSILIDSRLSIIGSYNLDLRSTYVDTELMVAVDSVELGRQLEGHLTSMMDDAWLVTADGSYQKPGHLTLEEAGFGKELLWRLLGAVLQPFRILV